MENWVKIKWAENYEISNFGNFRLFLKSENDYKFLKSRRGGYKKRYLRINIKNKDYYSHRLVLEFFKGKCPKGKQAAHLDGNPHNNNINNLDWVTPKENSSHKILHGTSGKGSKNAMSKLCENDIVNIRNLYSIGVCNNDLKKIYKISGINAIVSGKSWKHVPFKDGQKEKIKYWSKYWIRTSNERNKNKIRKP